MFWYAPEVFAEAAALGYEVKTRWPSYFAWRLAPLGAVGPRLAASACYSLSPHMVGAHVPAAWAVAPPPQILAARERAADRTYRALPGDLTDPPGLAEAADLAPRRRLRVRAAPRAVHPGHRGRASTRPATLNRPAPLRPRVQRQRRNCRVPGPGPDHTPGRPGDRRPALPPGPGSAPPRSSPRPAPRRGPRLPSGQYTGHEPPARPCIRHARHRGVRPQPHAITEPPA